MSREIINELGFIKNRVTWIDEKLESEQVEYEKHGWCQR